MEKKCMRSDCHKIAPFKSTNIFWWAEYSGIKPYTIRKKDDDDRFDSDVTHVQIINTDNGHSFIREVTYKLEWEDNVIFSWNPNIR